MLSKLAYSQKVLRALASEKRAGLVLPIVAGTGIVAGVHGAKKTVGHTRRYHSGFQPGIAETRVEV
jgi:hypothetical protein